MTHSEEEEPDEVVAEEDVKGWWGRGGFAERRG